MPFFTGSVSMGNITDAYADLEAKMTLVSDVGGAYPGLWSFVEAYPFTRSSVNYTARIWKCDGAVNAWGVTYHLYLIYVDANPLQRFAMFSEGWNTTTKLAQYGTPAVQTSSSMSGFSDYGLPSASLADSVSNTSMNLFGSTNTTANAATDWVISITNEHLALGFNIGTSSSYRSALLCGGAPAGTVLTYANLYLWFPTIAVATTTPAGRATRGANAQGYSYYVSPGAVLRPSGHMISSGPLPNPYTGLMTASPAYLLGSEASAYMNSLSGDRGPLAGMVILNEGTSVRNGDRVTLNGVNYSRFGRGMAGSTTTNGAGNFFDQSVWISENV